MAQGVNKVILVGHLGKDPEVKYTPSSTAVANFSMATSESWKDKNTGQKQERTEWHRVVVWGKLAEIVGQYLKKGALVYVGGKLQTRKYQDKEGKERYITEVVADEMRMLGGKPGDSSDHAPERQQPSPQPAKAGAGDFDDDIPF